MWSAWYRCRGSEENSREKLGNTAVFGKSGKFGIGQDERFSVTFELSDCILLDCDNDHSENPEDWLTPFDIALSNSGSCIHCIVQQTPQPFKG